MKQGGSRPWIPSWWRSSREKAMPCKHTHTAQLHYPPLLCSDCLLCFSCWVCVWAGDLSYRRLQVCYQIIAELSVSLRQFNWQGVVTVLQKLQKVKMLHTISYTGFVTYFHDGQMIWVDLVKEFLLLVREQQEKWERRQQMISSPESSHGCRSYVIGAFIYFSCSSRLGQIVCRF